MATPKPRRKDGLRCPSPSLVSIVIELAMFYGLWYLFLHPAALVRLLGG